LEACVELRKRMFGSGKPPLNECGCLILVGTYFVFQQRKLLARVP
jgi:hypothetical protein